MGRKTVKIEKDIFEEMVKYLTIYSLSNPDINNEGFTKMLEEAEKVLEETNE